MRIILLLAFLIASSSFLAFRQSGKPLAVVKSTVRNKKTFEVKSLEKAARLGFGFKWHSR
jgi:hypothetical protein